MRRHNIAIFATYQFQINQNYLIKHLRKLHMTSVFCGWVRKYLNFSELKHHEPELPWSRHTFPIPPAKHNSKPCTLCQSQSKQILKGKERAEEPGASGLRGTQQRVSWAFFLPHVSQAWATGGWQARNTSGHTQYQKPQESLCLLTRTRKVSAQQERMTPPLRSDVVEKLWTHIHPRQQKSRAELGLYPHKAETMYPPPMEGRRRPSSPVQTRHSKVSGINQIPKCPKCLNKPKWNLKREKRSSNLGEGRGKSLEMKN